MNIARGLGLVSMLIGVVLQPVGWMFTHWLTALSVAAIFIGVLLLLLGRDRETENDLGGESAGDRALPGDIHGNSGQMAGGRSTSWESHHSSEGSGSSD